MATVPPHTHTFGIPTASKKDLEDGVLNNVVVTPDVLRTVMNGDLALRLAKDQNLGDIPDPAAAITNLGVDLLAPAILPSRTLFDNPAGTARESVARADAVNRLGLGSPALPLRKLYPTAMYIEMGGFFSTSAQTWLDGNGNPAMTAAFWRSKIDDAVAAGVEHVVVGYLEGWGNFYYPPSFPFWDGYETGAAIATKYWRDNIPSINRPNFEDFDPVEVLLERCDYWGIKCWLGIGRQGDVELMGDLFGEAVVPGWTDPMRVGFTLAQRLTRAKTRILMMAQDLFNLYGAHDSLAGFKPGHEPAHIPSANQYYQDVVKNGFGGYPSLNSYKASRPSFKTMIVPAKLFETGVDITDATYAQAVADNGSDVWAWQDAAGPGYNYVLSDYTWLPSVTFSLSQTDNVQAYGERLRVMINRANNYARINNRRLEHWAIGEVWRMGRRPVAVLSIGAGYNTPGTTGVTFSATGAFTDAQVGSIVTTSGGKATVTDVSGVPNSVVATINRAFSTNSYSSTLWAWSRGYKEPYPATPTEYKSEFNWLSGVFERMCVYSLNFIANPAGTLKPPVTLNFQSFRSLAEGIYTTMTSHRTAQLDKALEWAAPRVIEEQVFEKLTGWAPTVYALPYDAQTSNFVVGTTVVGATSGATGVITADSDAGTTGILKINTVTGTFVDNETLNISGVGFATANCPGGITPAEYDTTIASFAPKFAGTNVLIKLTPDVGKSPAVIQSLGQGTMTVTLTVNGIGLKSKSYYSNQGAGNGNGTIFYIYKPNGAEFSIGMKIVSWGGLTAPAALLEVKELQHP